MTDEYLIWRLVLETHVSLDELETRWSLDDVVRANTMLNIQKTIQDLYIAGAADGK